MAGMDVASSNAESSHRFYETTAAFCKLLNDVGVSLCEKPVAERQGFEPWRRLHAYTLSKRAPSTTRPPLRIYHLG